MRVAAGPTTSRTSRATPRNPSLERLAAWQRELDALLRRQSIASDHDRARRRAAALRDPEERVRRADRRLPAGHGQDAIRDVRRAAAVLRAGGVVDLRHLAGHLRLSHAGGARLRPQSGHGAATDERHARRRRRSRSRSRLPSAGGAARDSASPKPISSRAEKATPCAG